LLRTRLVSNLLAVICSDSHVTPTFSVSDTDNGEKDEEEAVHRKQMMDILTRIALNTTVKN
jgi:hypothetical protein